MDVLGIGILQEFWKRHRDAEPALQKWIEIVNGAKWRTFMDCRGTFRSADQVKLASGVITVFNIKGNRYRLLAAVGYSLGTVAVASVLTHEEYSQDRWKDNL